MGCNSSARTFFPSNDFSVSHCDYHLELTIPPETTFLMELRRERLNSYLTFDYEKQAPWHKAHCASQNACLLPLQTLHNPSVSNQAISHTQFWHPPGCDVNSICGSCWAKEKPHFLAMGWLLANLHPKPEAVGLQRWGTGSHVRPQSNQKEEDSKRQQEDPTCLLQPLEMWNSSFHIK